MVSPLKTDRGPPYFRMSLRHVPNFVRNSCVADGFPVTELLLYGQYPLLKDFRMFSRVKRDPN